MERTDLIRAHCKKYHYTKEYEVFWLRNPYCQLLFCHSWSDPPHHIVTRGAGGNDEPENLVALCTLHHNEVNNNGWKTFADKYFEIRDKFYQAHKIEVPVSDG